MDRHELERLGDHLHGIGHRRRELAQRVLEEASDGPRRSRELYQELADVTTQAIDLMQQQRDILRKEIGRISSPSSPS